MNKRSKEEEEQSRVILDLSLPSSFVVRALLHFVPLSSFLYFWFFVFFTVLFILSFLIWLLLLLPRKSQDIFLKL